MRTHRTTSSTTKRGAVVAWRLGAVRALGLRLGFVMALGVLGTAAGLSAADRDAPPIDPAVMPIEEIVAGQRGYGLSVFSGREPVRFEVEVVGVIENMRPGASFVLARLSGRGLEETGVVAGMSGSPVYIDDRLVGAVAFGWPFSLEAIAGITPISMMRELAHGDPDARPVRSWSAPGTDLSDVDFADLASGELPEDLLEKSLDALRPRTTDGATSGILWHLNGFSPRTEELLAGPLGTVSAGGSTERGGPEDLRPGGAVAGVLVRGDMNMAATGTVTDRVGDEVLAFGHPFLGVGPTRIPMATADIITVLGSRYSSFKLSNVGEVVGAFNVDRAAGIRGLVGLEAPTIPIEITVRGDRQETYNMELADLPMVTPSLVAVSIISALDETTQSAGRAGFDLAARFALGDHGDLDLRQSFDGDNAGVQAAIYVLAITGFLEQNGFGTVDLESVEIELDQYPEPRTLRLVGGHASQSLVRPGDAVTVTLDLKDGEGVDSRRSLEVRVPTGIPAGRYSLLVGDGASANVARLQIEQTDPVTLEQALDYFRRLHSPSDLVALGVFAEPGLSVGGEVMPQLPGSLRSIWGAAASSNAKPVGLAIAQELVEPMERPLVGMIRIDLEVQRREPLAATGDGGSAIDPGSDASVGRDGGDSPSAASSKKADAQKKQNKETP